MLLFFLFFLLCHFPIGTTILAPMKIAVVSGYGSLEPEMQIQLQNSLKWFQSSFLVEKSKTPVEIQDIYQRIPEYQKFSSILVQTPIHRQNMKFQDLKTLLEIADFTVFVVAQDPKKCQRDPDLLAEALPIVLVPDERPPLAMMSICLQNNPRHQNPSLDSRFFYDLFRHEILHGLGYGLIIDKSSITHKPSEKYIWNHSNGLGQPENRHFLDFDTFALEFTKKHFSCENMKGVEADGERKNHLNEYIFGNELMTTHLEATGNIFSWISVGIIERTFNGPNQWYHINRTFISTEADQYSYGKKFGCDFLQKSCHDFIKITEKRSPTLKIAPFCSKNHNHMCYRIPSSEKLYKMSDKDCEMRRVIGDGIDNGGQQRRCPMIKHFPAKFEFFSCPPPPGG
ncbi:hypothetical protein L3Y34_019724 [Caenorhabditis briggsae]|uniref:Leishmanolysin-like peptidase n=2 Tax=Caenorhabditis briggsae TaxID=6238 RepID=A0AAE9DQ33_CAEBR|nr:hypothetical protein L3Y34_019724 [Caenorhabditis briggsae]